MIDDLKQILKMTIAEVLKSPQYLIATIRIYSKLYLGGNSCSTCERSVKMYFEKLKRDGMNKIELIEKVNKRTCKPNFKGLVFSPKAGGHINPEMLHDEIAEFYLLNGILNESHFEILPQSYIQNKRIKEVVKPIEKVEIPIEEKQNYSQQKNKRK